MVHISTICCTQGPPGRSLNADFQIFCTQRPPGPGLSADIIGWLHSEVTRAKPECRFPWIAAPRDHPRRGWVQFFMIYCTQAHCYNECIFPCFSALREHPGQVWVRNSVICCTQSPAELGLSAGFFHLLHPEASGARPGCIYPRFAALRGQPSLV